MLTAIQNSTMMNMMNRYAMDMCMSVCVVMEMCMMMCRRSLPENDWNWLSPLVEG